MKDKILKIAGVKSEKEFYKKYPSEEAFMKAHGKEFRKAKIGDAIPKNQNAQFTLPNARDLARTNMPAAESTARTTKTTTGPVNTATVGQSKENIAASNKAMGDTRKKEFEKKRKQQEVQKSARMSEKYNTEFTFPNGQTKEYDDMTPSEKSYVAGQATKDVFEMDAFQNPSGGVSINDFNPLDFVLGEMAGNLGTSVYEGVQQGSIKPILGAIADPVLSGAIAGGFSPGSGGSKLLKKELDPLKSAKKLQSLLSAATAGERQLASELVKQGSKAGAKETKNLIIDELSQPGLADGNVASPPITQLFTPESRLSTKEFKQGGKAVPKAQNAYLEFMKDKKNCRGASWKPGCGGDKGGSDGGMNMSNAPVTSKELTASGYTMADKKKIKQRAKDLQTDFPGISADDIAMAMGDSARVQAKFPNLPIIDKNIAKYNELKGQSLNEAHRYLPYSDYFFNYYRPYITADAQGKPNPLTVPEILSTQESPQAYRDRVNKNYKQREGGQIHKLQQLTDFGNPPIAQIGAYIGGEAPDTTSGMINLKDIYSKYDKSVTGLTDDERADIAYKKAQLQAQGSESGGSGSGPDVSGMLNQLGSIVGGGAGGAMARKGKKVPKYQFSNTPVPLGGVSGGGFNWDPGAGGIGGNAQPGSMISNPNANLNPPALNMGNLASGGVGTLQEQMDATNKINPVESGIKNTKDISKYFGAAGKIYEGFKALKEEKYQRKRAESTAKISDLTLQAASSRPEEIRRRYVRPEDALVQPNQLSPSYGVGTNYLAKDGTTISQIGGNPTEIQNMYNPGDLYSNLGYEPMSESDVIKQYRHGGYHKMQGGGGLPWDMIGQLGSGIGNAATGNNAGGNLGGTIGGTVGMAFGPAGAAIGNIVGTVAGGLLDKNKKKMEAANKKTQENLEKAAFQSGAQAIQARNNTYMEEGGWVSHDWQPQVITQFGEHSMHDLLKRDPMMDTLRTGGRITQNNMFPTDQYALGGELKTTWGGYAEPISHNPYMPGTGETVMFRGKSHEESDGNGHTGIGVKYGEGGHDSYTDYAEYGSRDADADVEVERGEPATEMLDPQTGEKNMVVFGNLQIPNHFLDQIGDKNAKGKKFKNYVADLGKDEAKQNKIVERATEELDGLEVYTPFDKLRFDALQATIEGANMKLKEAALRKSNASAVQNAINETAEEHGVDADALAKGKYKIDKKAMKEQAKLGKQIPKAQTGKEYPYHPITNPTGYKDRLSFSQDVLDMIDPSSQAWNKITPKYKLTEAPPAWDPKQKTDKFLYDRAFKTFKEQKAKGKTPYVPDLNTWHQVKLYKSALKDFQEQEAKLPKSSRKLIKISDSDNTTSTNKTPVTTTTNKTTVKPSTTTTTSGSRKKKVTVPQKTKVTVTPAPPSYQYDDSTGFLTDKTGRHINIPMDVVKSTLEEIKNDKAVNKQNTDPVQEAKTKKKGFDWMPYANQALEYLRPSDQEAFDFSQVYPEMAALAMNQLEPVQAQLYRPDLGTPMDISLQDQMNANQADFNALQRQTGYNPEALSALAAQKYAANSKVLGEQFRLNQAEKQRVYEGNRALLNDAQLKNLGILDTQMTRQETAKSKTKEQALEAMKSVADKIAKNKLENKTLGIYENLYKYRFDPSGRAINMNPLAQFDYSGSGSSKSGGGLASGLEFTYDANGNIVGTRKTKEEAKYGKKVTKNNKNGNIVRAIKNL